MMGKLVACRTCSKEIAKSAATCPQCGAKNRGHISIGAALGLIAVVVVVIAGVAGGSERAQQKRQAAEAPSANASASSSENVRVIDVTADKLEADYAANEVAADNQYKGQVLRVTGAVQSINKDFMNDAYVMLWTRNEFAGVHAMFAGGPDVLARLTKGQHITVRCRGAGKVITSPILKDCVLEQ